MTMIQKIKFVANYNFIGVLRVFSFEVFMGFVKPILLESPAYMLQIMTSHRIKYLDKMKNYIESRIIKDFFGFDP
jgi:hypothetical protein